MYNLIHKDENQRRLNALISELDNLKLDFNAIIEQLEGTSSPMRTLIPNSLELLLTQRYLDLSDDTYDILQRYYRMFNTINNNLRNVVQNREGVKKNLLSSKDEFLRLNEDLEKLLILFLKQLESY